MTNYGEYHEETNRSYYLKNGILNGPFNASKYDECKCFYKNGVLEGKYIHYYAHSKEGIECHFKNGVLNGKFTLMNPCSTKNDSYMFLYGKSIQYYVVCDGKKLDYKSNTISKCLKYIQNFFSIKNIIEEDNELIPNKILVKDDKNIEIYKNNILIHTCSILIENNNFPLKIIKEIDELGHIYMFIKGAGYDYR